MSASPADLILGLAMWGLPVAALLATWRADARRQQAPRSERPKKDASP